MPTTDQHARSTHARGASEETDRVPVPAWPSRDLERRASEGAAAETTTTTGAETTTETGPTGETKQADMTTTAPATELATTDSTTATPAADRPAARRASFLADLTRAMRTAAEEERTEVLQRCREDAETHIGSMRSEFSTAADHVRERADQDVAALEAWCAGELERIRRETEQNIAGRRAQLADELAAQESRLEQGVAGVAETVTAYERGMADFFERLLAEEDPSTFAVLARQLPEPPTFTGMPVEAVAAAATPETAPEVATLDPDALAAAEAEAAEALAEEGFEATAPLPVTAAPAADAPTTTRMTVAAIGLVSVASVSNFKRLLSRVDGIHAVQVSSGPQGEFIFSLTGDRGLDLEAAVCALPGFQVELRGASETAVDVVAHDLDTE